MAVLLFLWFSPSYSGPRKTITSGKLYTELSGGLPIVVVSVPMKKAGNFKLDKVPLKILKLSNKCFQTSIFHQQWLGIVVRTPDLHTAGKKVRGSNPVRGNKGNKGRDILDNFLAVKATLPKDSLKKVCFSRDSNL